MEGHGSPQWFIPTVLGTAVVPEQPRLVGLYIGIVLALLDRSGFPALEMGELRVTPPRGPSPASKGEQLFDGAFWELESLEEAPQAQRFPEVVPWTWGTGQVTAALVSHWHP